jgi:methylaspartate ammonia-lyase
MSAEDDFRNAPDDAVLLSLGQNICDAVVKPFGRSSIEDLQPRECFHVALACMALARAMVRPGLGDRKAQEWFQDMINNHWDGLRPQKKE